VTGNIRAFLITLTVALSAHSVARSQETEAWNRIRIDAFRPEFKAGGYSFASSAWFISFHESVEGPVHVDMQIPFAYVGRDRQAVTDWEFRLGNPYVGLSWKSLENPATLGFGMRFPILPDDAFVRVMQAADIHRYEAFVPDLWDFSVHSVVGDETTPVRARVRTNLWIPLHGSAEIVADYAFGLQQLLSLVLVRVEVLGRAGITGDDLVFGKRTAHDAGLSIEMVTPTVRPGVVVRMPIDGRASLDWVGGLSVSF